jgi:Family of unknown function (DUF6069)
MTTAPLSTHHEPGVLSTQPSTRRLVRSGALAGAVAAVCTTVVAVIASAADVSLEIQSTAIPIPAFAWWTTVGAALGVVLARLLRERRRFVVVTAIAVGLSLIPAIGAPDDTTTKAVLVGTHLLAAAIIIPTLSQRLTAINDDRYPRGDGTDPSQQPGLSGRDASLRTRIPTDLAAAVDEPGASRLM